jgi:hypothetical protein
LAIQNLDFNGFERLTSIVERLSLPSLSSSLDIDLSIFIQSLLHRSITAEASQTFQDPLFVVQWSSFEWSRYLLLHRMHSFLGSPLKLFEWFRELLRTIANAKTSHRDHMQRTVLAYSFLSQLLNNLEKHFHSLFSGASLITSNVDKGAWSGRLIMPNQSTRPTSIKMQFNNDPASLQHSKSHSIATVAAVAAAPQVPIAGEHSLKDEQSVIVLLQNDAQYFHAHYQLCREWFERLNSELTTSIKSQSSIDQRQLATIIFINQYKVERS